MLEQCLKNTMFTYTSDGQQSPLLVNVTSPTSSSTFTTTEPFGHAAVRPTYSQRSTLTEPDLGGSEVSYGNDAFIGAQRYVPSRESYSPEPSETPKQSESSECNS